MQTYFRHGSRPVEHFSRNKWQFAPDHEKRKKCTSDQKIANFHGMDVDLLKTFVEVYHTRHFARAADNLFITPSAVSARIRLLETQLGTALFFRERNNIRLTSAGERFLGHARNMLRLWEQAHYDVAIDADPQPNLTILTVPGLWDGVRLDWLRDLHEREPGLSLRVETLNSNQITTRLQQNRPTWASCSNRR
jgi:DNA-binding transcriptional LysR family regulator